ncbi:putative carboxy-terminal-processing protease [Magnetospirillum sp. LM-5]|uniref:S41 family peptidase n=1 Tax=Magnetospirillum sp. LM-5 TaxID=2681466 RepID=UPI001383173F|nr:S41 family peptidase [Magnetospirillum sp. LM-5]CAA7614457.1 putative carboxy-terminal-processing protease [Magnetospirillum sp. LM-5]
MNRLFLAAFSVLILISGASLADRADRALLTQAFSQAGLETPKAKAKAELLDEMISKIVEVYVEPKESHQISEAAAKAVRELKPPQSPDDAFKAATTAMSEVLDPHTAYLTPADMDDMRTSFSGQFGGVGMELTMKEDQVVVVAPIDDTPAARAGIKVDDRILKVDGTPTAGQSLMQVVSKIRGKVGTPVTLTLATTNGVTRDVVLKREIIQLQAVKGRLDGSDVAYVRVTQFAGGTAANLRSTLLDLEKAAGGRLKGIVLDLRRNPGGLLDQAIAVADLFLGDVPIVSTTGRRSQDRQVYSGRIGEIMPGLPIVVLIDGGSASASEIVAGALKDHRRAVLVGQKSFGKGSVQTILDLSEGGMRVTTSRYLRPSTQPVDKVGITPDIVTEPVEGSDPQLDRALKVVRGQ